MNILLWNQDWFAAELRKLGHTVTTMGFSSHLDVQIDNPIIHIDNAVKILPHGRPDLIIVLDNSSPVGLDGLYETDIPSLFYSVDTHHHSDLHLSLARVFDKVLIAQKDYIPLFEKEGLAVEWLPLWASELVEPLPHKEHGAVFVGTLNPKLNPDRVEFFAQLQKQVPLLCMTGAWTQIFPSSELVINQTVKGDLNFRVFEAMGAGALLLTEHSPNGLLELFTDGEHLVTYPKGDVGAAAARIRELLADPIRLRAIAARGRAEITAKHLGIHRTQRILEIASKLSKSPPAENRFHAMHNFSILGRRVMKIDTRTAAHAFTIALTLAERALAAHETLTPNLACHAALAAIRYDQLLGGNAGDELLGRLFERYPAMSILELSRIRTRLNSGKIAEATSMARAKFQIEPREVFSGAETIVQQLLEQI